MNLLTDSVGGVIKTSDRKCATNEDDYDRSDPKLGQRAHLLVGDRVVGDQGRNGCGCRRGNRGRGGFRRCCSSILLCRLRRCGSRRLTQVRAALYAESTCQRRSAFRTKVGHTQPPHDWCLQRNRWKILSLTSAVSHCCTRSVPKGGPSPSQHRSPHQLLSVTHGQSPWKSTSARLLWHFPFHGAWNKPQRVRR